MNKTVMFLLFSTCIVILSVAIIAVGPMTNKMMGDRFGYQNCALISDKIKLLKGDITKLKRMKNLCYRQKAMYNMEYTSFIINIILGFVCADLALIVYLGYGKDFEIQTGVIGLIAGIIGFILTLVYVCFSGYIFTKDAAYQIIDFSNPNNPTFFGCVEKLYSNWAKYKFELDDPKISNTAGTYITEYETDRSDDANCIRYKDLGKKMYNYNSEYYKKFNDYNKNKPEESYCTLKSLNYDDAAIKGYNVIHKTPDNKECEYLYGDPKTENNNKYLFDRWLAALVLACVVLICNLGLAFYGFMSCSNFGASSI
jgi:hypothetical protein